MPDAPIPASWSSSSCDIGDIAVSLTPEFQKNYTAGTTVGYRIKVTAWNACGMDDSIFRYYRKPTNPTSGTADSVFSGVCSWVDMTELPEAEPEADTNPAGFRLNYIDLVVDSETIANEIWALIQTQAQELVNTIKDGQTLEDQAAVRVTAQ
jgi:hypothetical protein